MKRFKERLPVGTCALALILAAVASSPRAALADAAYGFVQITCAPELRYFSIRRFGLSNLPQDVADRILKSPRTSIAPLGIYDSLVLQDAPAECSLVIGTETVRIRVVGIFKGTASTSVREIVNLVEVSANAKQLGQLYLDDHRFSVGPDLIEVFHDGVEVRVRKCSYNEHLSPQPQKSCATEGLR